MSGPELAVITGASSGIGEAVARRLVAEHGSQLLLVARREDRLRELADELGPGVSYLAADVTDPQTPELVAGRVLEHPARLSLLVNNAGASWRATFADGGHANVKRTMELNFDAQVRMTEALLPILRESSPSSIVNVASTAARVSRAGAGAYSASKYALAGWSDSLHLEEAPNGVHVGLVLPGFIETEGFPAKELKAKLATRWLVSTPQTAAAAILEAGPGGKAERYVPRPYALAAYSRTLLPSLVRRILTGGVGDAMLTSTGADATEAAGAKTP